MSDEFNESLQGQSRALFHHAELPNLSYEDYRAFAVRVALLKAEGMAEPNVSQAGNVYLQLLRDYLTNVPDDGMSDTPYGVALRHRTIAIGNLMVEIQELLL